jgi:hypothetical protein
LLIVLSAFVIDSSVIPNFKITVIWRTDYFIGNFSSRA